MTATLQHMVALCDHRDRPECPILIDLAQEQGGFHNKEMSSSRHREELAVATLGKRHKINAMNLFSRMILILVLAVFTAGSVVHAAGATSMVFDMSTVEMTDTDAACMGSADCGACGDEDGTDTTACNLICSAGGFAVVPASYGPELKPTTYDLEQRFSDLKLSGVGSLPLCDPPRSIL